MNVPRAFIRSALFGVAAVLAVASAHAQSSDTTTMGSPPSTKNPAVDGPTQLDTSGNLKSELESCKTGRTGEALALCRREAYAAQAERKRNGLTAPKNVEQNAVARCDAQRDDQDRMACKARVLGYGTTTGSVEGGGLLHQVETAVVPAGETTVRVEPQTSGPVVLIPEQQMQQTPRQQ